MDERWNGASISRRRFLGRSLGAAALLGATVGIVSCGDGDDSGGGTGPGSDCEGRVSGDVSSNSGHVHLVEDVCLSDRGDSVILLLSGFGHTHTATLSAEQVDDALNGLPVSVTSSSDNGHTHDVTFN